MMYLVTTEGVSDGMWLEEPAGFDTEREARDHVTKLGLPPAHHVHAIYECRLLPSPRGGE